MRPFQCVCQQTIFFENTVCLACQRELGWCPVCENMTALVPDEAGGFHCGWNSCAASLVKCHNYAVEAVCNRCVAVADEPPAAHPLCDACRFNRTIPDLTVPGNREKWGRLEVAKRRLFYTLDFLQLPYGAEEDGFRPGLSFDFLADGVPGDAHWHAIGEAEQVYTGHADGRITINIREADSVEREKMRVNLNEPQRTLIGHLRHEIGHYYWDLLVKEQQEAEFQKIFGDHNAPTYAEALQSYYANGPAANWQQSFISAYSTMHPWEDFAETFSAYLDMRSLLDTAVRLELMRDLVRVPDDVEEMAVKYAELAVKMNEMNRAMGLADLVPEVLVPPVVNKLRFIHLLAKKAPRQLHRRVAGSAA